MHSIIQQLVIPCNTCIHASQGVIYTPGTLTSFHLALIILVAIIILLSAAILFIMRQKFLKERLSDRRLAESMKILFRDKKLEIYIGNYPKKSLYKYQSNKKEYYSVSLEEQIKLIHPEDYGVIDLLTQKIALLKEDYIISEFRLFNEEIKKYCYYEFVIAITERDKRGKVIHYIFSRRDCSKEKETILNQQKTINDLNSSLKVGKLYRWEYCFITNSNKLISYNGKVYELDDHSINYLTESSKRQLLKYIHNLKTGKYDKLTDVELWIYSLYHQENRLFKLTATTEKSKEGEPLAIHGIWKDITEEDKLHRNLIDLQKNIVMAMKVGEISTWKYDCKKKIFSIIYGVYLGKDSEEGMSLGYFINNMHPDDRNMVLENIEKGVANEIHEVTYKYRFKTDEGWRWFLNSFVPILEDGVVTSLMGVRRDITLEEERQKKLEDKIMKAKEEGDALKMVLDNLPIPVLMKNMETNIYSYANKEAINQFGAEVGSDFIYKVLNSTTGKEILDFEHLQGTTEVIETTDGRIRETLVSRIPIIYNDEKQLLSARIDLTETIKYKRDAKLLSAFMPALKAYSWFFDSRLNTINIQHNLNLERNLDNVLTPQDFIQLVHPEDRNLFVSKIGKLISADSKDIRAFQFRIDIEEKGVYEWWETYPAIESKVEKGQESRLINGISININEKKKTELELSMLNKHNELILNNTNSMLVYITSDYDIIWSNAQSALEEHEKDLYRVGNKKCYAAKGFSKPCPNCPVKVALMTQSVTVRETKTDEGIWHKATATPIQTSLGIPSGAILRVDNVSDYKQLIADLEVSRLKAEESDRLKSAFLANMSHEIRTPLNAIVGFSELLQNTDEPEEKAEFVKIINSNNELLLRLISDILDLSKIESGSIELKAKTFDYSAYIEQRYTTHLPIFEKPDVKLILHNPYKSCIIKLDSNRLTQIGMNFLTNAYKYTQKGHIRMGYEYRENGLVLFVEDTGIGISKVNQRKLFERFEKIGSFIQGTGLGLSIAKATAETMGGKVGVISNEGKGSLFWAWIPCDAEIEHHSEQLNELDGIYLAMNLTHALRKEVRGAKLAKEAER